MNVLGGRIRFLGFSMKQVGMIFYYSLKLKTLFNVIMFFCQIESHPMGVNQRYKFKVDKKRKVYERSHPIPFVMRQNDDIRRFDLTSQEVFPS